jgi:hypothetical protein
MPLALRQNLRWSRAAAPQFTVPQGARPQESWSPLNDPAHFAQVVVDTEGGTIACHGGIDLVPEPLYQQARAHPLVAA